MNFSTREFYGDHVDSQCTYIATTETDRKVHSHKAITKSEIEDSLGKTIDRDRFTRAALLMFTSSPCDTTDDQTNDCLTMREILESLHEPSDGTLCHVRRDGPSVRSVLLSNIILVGVCSYSIVEHDIRTPQTRGVWGQYIQSLLFRQPPTESTETALVPIAIIGFDGDDFNAVVISEDDAQFVTLPNDKLDLMGTCWCIHPKYVIDAL